MRSHVDVDILEHCVKQWLSRNNTSEEEVKQYNLLLDTCKVIKGTDFYKSKHDNFYLAEGLLKDSMMFLAHAKKTHSSFVPPKPTEKSEDLGFRDKVGRIMLAVACEKSLKALFLVRGFCVHKIKEKGNNAKPLKVCELQDKEIKNETLRFNALINNLNLVFVDVPPISQQHLIDVLSLAQEWRNDDLHFGIAYYGSQKEIDMVADLCDVIQQHVQLELSIRNKK